MQELSSQSCTEDMKPFKFLYLTVEGFMNSSLQWVKLLFSVRFEMFARKIKSLEKYLREWKSTFHFYPINQDQDTRH